jgi:hypothetical protein
VATGFPSYLLTELFHLGLLYPAIACFVLLYLYACRESLRNSGEIRGKHVEKRRLDPHEVGQETANWTTELLAGYLGRQTGVMVTHETVRVYLHAHGYVCKRPTWTLRRKAEEKADYVGKDCG